MLSYAGKEYYQIKSEQEYRKKKMDRQKQKDMLRKMKGVGRKLIHVI